MAVVATSEQPPSFRIDMLWRDERYRGGFIQAVTMIVVMLIAAWLVSNVVTNLAALGKTFSFGFLFEPSNYEINQHLIEYSSRDTHGRAAIVGILNTLLVAVLGCITALVIGVVAGVLRLSNNWLVARMMTIYVETFRNVPVLLWILLTLAVIINVLPVPASYRGLEAVGAIVPTNRGIYVPRPLFGDGSLALFAVFAVSAVAVFFLRKAARKRREATGQGFPVVWVSLAVLVLPTVAAYFLFGQPITLEYPEFQRFNFRGGINVGEAFIALWLALSLYTGAFIAEVVRAGIMSVSRGQSEAAYALGLSPGRTMNLIILPQALRVIIPPLISQFLNLTKNSSLAIAVSYEDISGTLGKITLNQTGREMECILLLMAFYLFASLTISGVMNWYNNRVKLVER